MRTGLAFGVTLLAHAAAEGGEEGGIGADAFDVDLVAAAVVGDAGLGAGGEAGDVGEDDGREEGAEGEEGSVHGGC